MAEGARVYSTTVGGGLEFVAGCDLKDVEIIVGGHTTFSIGRLDSGERVSCQCTLPGPAGLICMMWKEEANGQ